MFTENELEELIQNIENEFVEFKRDLTGKKGFIKDICAFANSSEGFIIVGIEDETRIVSGINKEALIELEEKASNIISDNFDNRPPYIARVMNYKDKLLLCFKVNPGELIPYYVKSEGKQNGTYVRIGSSSRAASQEEIAELERRRLHISFDSTELVQTNKNFLDYGLMEKTLEKIYLKRDLNVPAPSDRYLESIKILKKYGNNLIPTVGGMLLFGYRDKIAEYLPQSQIKCARFKDNNSIEYLDKKEFAGPLIKQFEDAMKFFELNEKKSAKIEGLYREEDYILPLIAVREAIVNAIVHRDYSITGSDIKFNIYDNKIEIISPGRLPFGMSKSDLGKGISEARNKVIAKAFLDLGLIEQWGQGIKKILDLTAKKNLQTPEFSEISNFFKVTLFKTPKTNILEEKIAKITFKSYSLKEIMKVIEYAKENNSITNLKCQEILGVKDYKAKHILDRLLGEGIFKASGKGKGRKYLINK